MTAATLARPEQKPYTPHGAAGTLLYDRSPEIILDGPAGTGKSRACLEKLHIVASKYPGARILICRKTRASLTQSALVTFEQHVLPDGSPIKAGPQREQRSVYHYPNGSEIVCGGLGVDGGEKTRVMSTEYDLIYVQEAREVLESEWEELSSRLRNGRVPYQQLLGDTNPDAPGHWIRRRASRGQLTLLPSRHEDNPKVTPAYLARLDALTGVRHKRLRLGLWVAAEGAIYGEVWDAAHHLVERRPIPADWNRYLAVDFGFTNPFVCQWWAVDPDGRLIRYRELYRSQTLVEDHAHEIRRQHDGEPLPVAIVCDHDAEDRATLERHLACDCPPVARLPKLWMGTTAATKDVSPGIQATAQRLRERRLLFQRDSLVQRDDLLDERKLPTCTEEEVEGYVWAPAGKALNPDGSALKEEPMKLNDHGLDAARYMVAFLDLRNPIEQLAGKTFPISLPGRPPAANLNPPDPFAPPGGAPRADGLLFPAVKW